MRKRLIAALVILILLAGLTYLLYPTTANQIAGAEDYRIIRNYRQTVKQMTGEQILHRLVGGLWGKVEAQQAAMEIVLAGTHVARLRAIGIAVRQIPVYDGFHASLGEEQRIHVAHNFRLDFLVLLVPRIRRNRHFRDLQGQVELLKLVHHGAQVFR